MTASHLPCARCATSSSRSITTLGSPPTSLSSGGYAWDGTWREKLLPALHPVVRTHPESGRNGLFVNRQFTRTIFGLSDNESNAVLEMLYNHCIRPEFTCRFRWRAGSVAFWDNRATLHYALDDYGTTARYAHRVTLRGDKPFGPAMPLPAT